MQQADRGQAAASVPAGGIRPRPARRRRRKRGDGLLPYLYVAPALLVVGLVFAYPLVKIFDFARKQVGQGLIPTVDVGTDNYRFVLNDSLFRSALGHNAVLLLVRAGAARCGATILAALLHERLPGWQIHRFLLFMPYVLAIPVVGAVFNYLFEFNGGLNQALRDLGLGFLAQDWLGDPNTALIVIGFVVIWKELGFGVILFLARLASAPEELYEAARVDGAGFWATMRSVTVPHLRPAMEFFAVVELINMLSWVFAYIYVMTAGVLVTSRVSIGLAGERMFPLDGLDPAGDGVELLLDRGRDVQPDLPIDPDGRPAAVEICRLADGLPLAIELAAAHARSLPLAGIRDGMADRLAFLTSRGLGRHGSVAASLDWSLRLVDGSARLALAALSIIDGRFPLDVAVAVTGGDRAAVETLVDHSLLQFDAADGRYVLLETVREYATTLLTEEGAADLAHARLLEWGHSLRRRGPRGAGAGRAGCPASGRAHRRGRPHGAGPRARHRCGRRGRRPDRRGPGLRVVAARPVRCGARPGAAPRRGGGPHAARAAVGARVPRRLLR